MSAPRRYGIRRPAANRGKTWEKYLDGLHLEYTQTGRAAVTRNHFEIHQKTQVDSSGCFRASFGSPAAVDYRLDCAGWSLLFDAKQISGKTFPWKNLHPHQAQYLDDVERQGDRFVGLILLHSAGSQTGMVLRWQDLREEWHRWHDHSVEQSRALKTTPIQRGQGSISLEELASRAIYAGSTVPFVGSRFDFLTPTLSALSSLESLRRSYRHNLNDDARHRHTHLRKYQGPSDLFEE
jgi:penicillin-binding protein-related factor A (putative recombinase)